MCCSRIEVGKCHFSAVRCPLEVGVVWVLLYGSNYQTVLFVRQFVEPFVKPFVNAVSHPAQPC